MAFGDEAFETVGHGILGWVVLEVGEPHFGLGDVWQDLQIVVVGVDFALERSGFAVMEDDVGPFFVRQSSTIRELFGDVVANAILLDPPGTRVLRGLYRANRTKPDRNSRQDQGLGTQYGRETGISNKPHRKLETYITAWRRLKGSK